MLVLTREVDPADVPGVHEDAVAEEEGKEGEEAGGVRQRVETLELLDPVEDLPVVRISRKCAGRQPGDHRPVLHVRLLKVVML